MPPMSATKCVLRCRRSSVLLAGIDNSVANSSAPKRGSSTYKHHIQSFPLSLRFNGNFFSDGPGLAGAKMSPFWILLELRMMEEVVTTGAARRAKLQSNCCQEQTNALLFTGWMPFLLHNQQCQSTEGTYNRFLITEI